MAINLVMPELTQDIFICKIYHPIELGIITYADDLSLIVFRCPAN